MKVSRNKVEPSFTPFTLNITVESEEEARALYAVFNHSHNRALFEDDIQDGMIEKIGLKYRVSDGVIANGVTYNEFYK